MNIREEILTLTAKHYEPFHFMIINFYEDLGGFKIMFYNREEDSVELEFNEKFEIQNLRIEALTENHMYDREYNFSLPFKFLRKLCDFLVLQTGASIENLKNQYY